MVDKRKIVLVGTGFVGMSMAYSLVNQGGINELVLIDVLKDKAEGEAMDLSHGIPCAPSGMKIKAGDYDECKDANIVVITAGANQKPGQTRLELAQINAKIMKEITENVVKSGFKGIFIVASNPVDLMTYVVSKVSGFPDHKVIGSGTVLDTARLKQAMGEKLGVDARNIHTFVIGEHGDSEVIAWSITNIGGMSMHEFCRYTGKCNIGDMDKIAADVKNSAYHIIEKKGATYYAIAVAVAKIVECIAGDENSILTVSSVFDGQYGISDVALSVPTKVGGDGIEKILEVPFSRDEMKGLRDSSSTLKEMIKEINF